MRLSIVAPSASRSRARPIRTIAILAIGLGSALCVLTTGCSDRSIDNREESGGPVQPSRVVGLGRIEPELKIVDLTCEAWGTVDEILIDTGEHARRGQSILSLLRDVEKAGLKQSVAAVKVQRSTIVAAEASLARAHAQAANARRRYDRISVLRASELEAQQALENAETELESLDQEVNRLEAGLVAARAFLEQAQADSMRALAELNRRLLRAPTDGQVLSLDVTIGSPVSPEKAIGAFAPESRVVARCEIDELFADMVEIGQDAHVRRQGSIDTLAVGTVSFVGPYLRKKSLLSDEVGDLEDRRVREINVMLEDARELLLGTRIECVIDID